MNVETKTAQNSAGTIITVALRFGLGYAVVRYYVVGSVKHSDEQ